MIPNYKHMYNQSDQMDKKIDILMIIGSIPMINK